TDPHHSDGEEIEEHTTQQRSRPPQEIRGVCLLPAEISAKGSIKRSVSLLTSPISIEGPLVTVFLNIVINRA
ncbi:MAG: hypothetical protein ACETV1_04615, partial [Candidatus Bathyarchaeia archaeon]